jgi:hypothetical protein
MNTLIKRPPLSVETPYSLKRLLLGLEETPPSSIKGLEKASPWP